jgi:hypothetical protein
VLFAGDTLFALGCGRVFEGTFEQMWSSLARLKALPPETTVYCGHEYTQANARFALTIDPDNAALVRRAKEVDELRSRGAPTLPTTIGWSFADQSRSCRPDDPAIRRRLAGSGLRCGRCSPRSAGARTRRDPPVSPAEIIRLLELAPWRAHALPGERAPSGTAIYYLLHDGEVSRWHRVDADELWHWYGGSALGLTMSPDGARSDALRLGPDLATGERPQILVPAGTWQCGQVPWLSGRSPAARSRPGSSSNTSNSPRPAGSRGEAEVRNSA